MNVSVTLVTGFLGAGKTTFVNRLLHNEMGLAIAAIVNDFGSINIDAALISENTEDVIGLKNGCICCSLQGDLLRTLKTVLNGQRKIDHIVIEASGVSDPQGIIEVLMDPVVREAVKLDAVVTIVDVEGLTDNHALYVDRLWLAQLRSGDFVGLSKGTESERKTVSERLCDMGKVVLFDSAEPPTIAVLGRGERETVAAPSSAISANDRFATVEWEWEGEVETAAFQACIEALAPKLVRAKGIINLSRSREVSHSFNLVGRRASMEKLSHRQSKCQLVLIGERAVFDPDQARQFLFQTFADLKAVY